MCASLVLTVCGEQNIKWLAVIEGSRKLLKDVKVHRNEKAWQ